MKQGITLDKVSRVVEGEVLAGDRQAARQLMARLERGLLHARITEPPGSPSNLTLTARRAGCTGLRSAVGIAAVPVKVSAVLERLL